jgi:hypothetical protein
LKGLKTRYGYFYFGSNRIGLAKSKSCNPFLIIVVSVHRILFSIKLDHIISHTLHLNSPRATSGFIVFAIL